MKTIKPNGKLIFNAIFLFVFFILLVSTMRLSVKAVSNYPLVVAGTVVTDENNNDIPGEPSWGTKEGKASFVPASDGQSGTLTLNNFKYTTANNSSNNYAIKYTGMGTLTIVLVGNNKIELASVNAYTYGICHKNESGNNVVITSDSYNNSLEITKTGYNGTAIGDEGDSNDSGTLTITGKSKLKITGIIDVIKNNQDIVINDGAQIEVTAQGFGVTEGSAISSCGKITIGGNAKIIANAFGNSIEASAIIIEGNSHVKAASKNGTCIAASHNIIIRGKANVIACGTDPDELQSGLHADGNVSICGDANVSSSGGLLGIAAGTITIDDNAIVNATGEIFATATSSGDFTIKGNSRLIAKGNWVGIMLINGGKILIDENCKVLVSGGEYYAISGDVKNTISGVGWTDEAGTTGKAIIPVVSIEREIDEFKRVQFPAQIDEDISANIEKGPGTPDIEIEGITPEMIWSIANAEERKMITLGVKTVLTLRVNNADSSISASEKQSIEAAMKKANPNAIVGMFLDLSLVLRIGDTYQREITSLNGRKIIIKIKVPEKFNAPSGKKRTFYIIVDHNGQVGIVKATTEMSIPFEAGQFSTYALAYSDEAVEAVTEGFNTSIKVVQKDGKLKISWDKVDGVSKVEVFLTYCGNKFSSKATKKTSGTKVTIKKLNGKALDFKKNFKLYLAAYDSNGRRIGKSLHGHFVGKDNEKYTNPKSIKLGAKSISIAKGQSYKVKASVKLEDKGKKQLSNNHAPKLRYRSTNSAVAAVDKKGNITGIAAGSCDVYVYAKNGIAKKITVTVTE
ncbi:Ig-like domain-containing protein [Butyrivibrio sp. FC2001]|uniref:Ig-like domain-containing protein n=1 Tax=Butyrivibrio sp. FC2001 TaxID=1280671 RepID=UPI0004275B46|nr:Ig-like domain-containing protein [Butyrivibrio sp. FC2001]